MALKARPQAKKWVFSASPISERKLKDVRQQLRVLSGLVALICLSMIAYSSLCPLDSRPRLYVSKQPIPAAVLEQVAILERFTAYATLGFFCLFAVPRRWRLSIALLVVCTAVILEVSQAFLPDRDARLLDLFEKAGGAICGIAAAWVLDAWVARRQ